MTQEFTPMQIAMLQQLPVVRKVNATRIQYTDAFRREFLLRDRRGESPTVIFRSVGLGPEVIGHKRIERCTRRWRDTADAILARGGKPVWGDDADGSEGAGGADVTDFLKFLDDMPRSESDSVLSEMMIIINGRRIARLEKEVERLTRIVHDMEGATWDDGTGENAE
ncbi:hypothetical protein CS006_09270 [Bifidobacterium primatium]|uniref:Uncharacterized protein n=2 Tax=Bifidobacterium TaxID=1678 RepID=A0A2M9H7F1_9BIFI|nr:MULTISPECIES: hypothetical protein [Bifidobacterium]NEG95636.1 hypothetical protein [Bifidobacterium sp. SMB2]NEH11949.1 hypothetical protein [Bifidobacterium saimiriisciurei]PJM72739.1 hypothetical protein CS006_09270 [Bifidobacterium primatium]